MCSSVNFVSDRVSLRAKTVFDSLRFFSHCAPLWIESHDKLINLLDDGGVTTISMTFEQVVEIDSYKTTFSSCERKVVPY